ncbi:vacuolar-type H+-ATPase subunit H [Anaerosolibacter carboniphilus]|uniref:Vacuolar-type H+-ATPase subunit H n=1 Tax=Anaerosolibacter carboniphilus TaxID=1417629 RepID=A0A841KW08_9FIRM|nr:ATPase [Anaerosolibacter carboniphilus]MBB6217824.1 vacuolar-type H+-ATPase subunit H [Anaerosolibacter carboniphilus]
MNVLRLLDELEDIVENSSTIPFAGKTLVDRGDILDIIKEIRIQLPDEVKQAQWIKEERQRILVDAQQEAEAIMKDARTHIEEMVEKDEITRLAQKRAEEIIEQGQAHAKEIRLGARQYADELLAGIEESLEKLGNTIKHNRKELKGMKG